MSNYRSKEDIYRDILFRAADVYELDYEDIERDIGQQFDPIIRFMSGAMAQELEKIHDQLQNTEMRLQDRLAKILLPEYFHLPRPAHALASASTSSSMIIEETTQFKTRSEDEEKDGIFMSPVFPIRSLPAQIELVLTENEIVKTNTRKRGRRPKKTEKGLTQKLLIGFSLQERIKNWQGAALFFDLVEGNKQSSERALFLSSVNNGRCVLGETELAMRNGLPKREVFLEDHLNGNEKLQMRIRSFYEKHFLTFLDSEVPEVETESTEERVKDWFSKTEMAEEEIAGLQGQIPEDISKDLCFLEFHFSTPIEVNELKSRLIVQFNVFPVINRRLVGNEKGGHHFLKSNMIKWVDLQPEDDFLAIRKVYEEKPPEYPTFIYKPFAQFTEDKVPTYTMRFGGIGRWDEYHAWKRLAYIVSVLQENYKHEDLIESVVNSLSLEEVHQLLGKKIAVASKDIKPTKDIYILLHSGVTSSLRARIEYWTCIGEKANFLPGKTKMECVSKEKPNFVKGGIHLLTSTSDGRDPMNRSEQLDAMKSALLSRGRIVTREDIKGFCRSFLNDDISDVKVYDSVGSDPRFNFGMTRILTVELVPAAKAKEKEWAAICDQVQSLLKENSTSTVPFNVLVNEL